MTESESRYGWESDFPSFRSTQPRIIRVRIQEFIRDASMEQIRAWDASIPALQREVGEVLDCDADARRYTAILEYELPMESRRPDVVFLIRGTVLVLELKGKDRPSQADVDQAAAYARDLSCYHRECAERSVVPVLVPTLAKGRLGDDSGVHIVGPDALDGFIEELAAEPGADPLSPERFLDPEAYCPLPTLVKAARELFEHGNLRRIRRAHAATEPALEEIHRIIREAAQERSRRLILLTGVPGAGKTLVGLQIVHAHFLDDLTVPRPEGTPTAPAVFLSGNGPLVEVLQYQLKGAGGGGKTFVRGVKEYVKRYSAKPNRVPPEHVLVFDEAQRAYDAEQVQEKHRSTPGFKGGKSEPEHFIEFAERVPEWCVVIGLIGSGQEIHIGEEAGLIQWRHAVEGAEAAKTWKVHGPEEVRSCFEGSAVSYDASPALSLDTGLRFHSAQDVHCFVAALLENSDPALNAQIAARLERAGYHLRLTRDLELAKNYLRERYTDNPEARFGLLASSRDKSLESFGVENGYNATKNVRPGPWYGGPEDAVGRASCRHLISCVTEFGAQGLELDAVLLAWGTDLQRIGSSWSSDQARRYQRSSRVKDRHQLRINAYRVLLTRGRDATVVFVPGLTEMDATNAYLEESGFRVL